MLSFLQQAARLHRKAAAKDGLLSAVLAVILCVSLASPAFAAEIGHEGAVRQMAAREIESETARMLSGVAVQLEAQGQLDMLPIYEEILTAEIEARVNSKYGLAPQAGIDYEIETFYFPNGGAVACEGPAQTKIVHFYLTPAQFLEYVYTDKEEVTLEVLLDLVTMDFKNILSLWQIPAKLKMIIDAYTCEEISNKGGEAEVMIVSNASGTEVSTSLLSWDDSPFASVVVYNDNYHVSTY